MISVRIEGEGAREVLRFARREVKKRMKRGMLAAAEEHILPKVQTVAPAIVREALTVKGRATGPILTTRGARRFDRITGLLNFGGNVHTPIEPKNKEGHQALSIGPGIIRARVTAVRHYHGKRFIETGIDAGMPAFEGGVLEAVMDSFNGLPHEP